MKKLLFSIICMCSISVTQSQNITGDWYGLLDMGKSQIRVILHVDKDGKNYSATLDSPDQGVNGISMDKTIVKKNKIEILHIAAMMNFKGEYNKKQKTIKGIFKQGQGSTELTFTREEQEKKINRREQEPEDYPYYVEEVKIKNKSEEIVLAGTLTLPEDKKMDKVVILISGSGAQDRNADLGPMNHRPFLVWSDYLTRNGVGVLRYDDRGTAKSTGNFQTATSADFSTDAEAALEYLKSREDLEGVDVGLMGHSEGGMIAPMVAARNKDVDFVILLAAPGVSNDQLLLKQKEDIARAAKLPEKMITYDQECGKRVFDFIKENKEMDESDFKSGLAEIVKANVADYHPFIKGGKPDSELVETELEQYLSPWFRYFISYEPMGNIASMQCPVLAVNGTLDIQVSNDENLAAIETALKKGRNENYKVSSYKGLNHLLQMAETGEVAEYAEIEETVNEKLMLDVLKWIRGLNTIKPQR